MNINDDIKRPYQPPRLKVVSFMVEHGFVGSVGVDLFAPEGTNRGLESYTDAANDGGGFWGGPSDQTGSTQEYDNFNWSWR